VQSFTQYLGSGLRTLADGRTVATIPAGGTFTSGWLDMPIPANAADTMTLRLEVDAFRYHVGKVDETTIPGTSTSQQVVLVDTAYYCAVDSIAPASTFGDPVVISGHAIDRMTTAPLPTVPLKLVMNVKGFEKVNDLFTDATGAFSYTYTPQPGENGIYNLSCIHPDVLERPDHGSFTIKRISVSPTSGTLNIPKNYEQTIPVKVTTTDATTASNLRIAFDAVDQPSGTLPAGVHVVLPAGVTVAPNSSQTLNLKISADNTAAANSALVFSVYADETGASPIATINLDAFFSEAKPALYFTPSFVETGVTLGGSITESVTLENRGLADMTDVRVVLQTQDGSPLPAWINLVSAGALGTMAVGDMPVVSISLAPDTTVPQGNYAFNMHVTSSNHPARDIPIYAAVTASGQGDVLFKASDIFTATLDANGNPIQGLQGVSIRVQNEKVLSIDQTLTTDVLGEALFTALPAGQYKFRATVANHQEVAGRFWIKPGITVTQDIFLDYNLVTVNWTVNEIVVKDKYDVILNITYETNVPAPVVVIEPAGINLPKMVPGDVFNGEFTITNHGLIRADNVNLNLPTSDANFKYEFLVDTVPTSIQAKQVITVPYRITMLTDPGNPAGTGGGCWSYRVVGSMTYDYVCANGTKSGGGSSITWSYSDSSTCGGGGGGGCCGGGGGGGGGYWGGGPGGGGGGGYVPSYKPLAGLPVCMPDCPDGNCYNPGGNGSGGGR